MMRAHIQTGEGFSTSIGMDSVTEIATYSSATDGYSATGSIYSSPIAFYSGYPGIGYHYLAPIEKATAGTIEFQGAFAQLFEGILNG